MTAFDDAIRFGGLVMAHAAWIASDLEEGSLVCPFALVQTGDEQHVVAFESETQAESIARGKANFDEQRKSVDFWAFAREGLLSYVGSDQAKIDVLTVSSWKRGLDEPVVLRQRFIPKAQGSFRLVGPLEIAVHGMIPAESTQKALRTLAVQGIQQHSHGDLWVAWSSA
jgi:hypothetical protein